MAGAYISAFFFDAFDITCCITGSGCFSFGSFSWLDWMSANSKITWISYDVIVYSECEDIQFWYILVARNCFRGS